MDGYQFTAQVQDIDIKRILRENVLDGCKNYVFITIRGAGIVFFSKKFAAKAVKYNVMNPVVVKENGIYGLISIRDTVENSIENSTKGSTIVSQGFTHYLPIMRKEDIDSILNGIEKIAACEKEEAEQKSYAETVKIIGG